MSNIIHTFTSLIKNPMETPITDLLKEKLNNLRSEIINTIIEKLKTYFLVKNNESYLLPNVIAFGHYDSTAVIVGIKIITDHNIELEIEDDNEVVSYPTSNYDIKLLLQILSNIETNQK